MLFFQYQLKLYHQVKKLMYIIQKVEQIIKNMQLKYIKQEYYNLKIEKNI